MAGLLHDIGKVVINNNSPKKFGEIIKKIEETSLRSINVEEEVLGFKHTEAGYLLGKKWGFPDALCEAILNHHSPDTQNFEYPEPYYAALAGTIALSDAICVRLGVGYMKPMPEINLGVEKWIKNLGISETRLEEIVGTFKERYIIEKMTY